MTSGMPHSHHRQEIGSFFNCQAGKKAAAAGAFDSPYALELDRLLWSGDDDHILPLLRSIVANGPSIERAAAGWVLARWEAEQGNTESAHQAILGYHTARKGQKLIDHLGPFLLAIQLCAEVGDLEGARKLLDEGIRRFDPNADLVLAQLQISRVEGVEARQLLEILRSLYEAVGLSQLALLPDSAPLLDRLCAASKPSRTAAQENMPLVSVIMPVYNAAATLPTALRGLCEQSWSNLEVLVIDDGSTDNSVPVARAIAEMDERIHVHDRGFNEGAYPARNYGLSKARGAFVTVHDADDWSHPQKIELQVSALLQDERRKASVSHWVRTSNDLEMTRVPSDGSWVHRNVSSLMFRSSLRDEIGYWDRVRVNADTEYYYRILHLYGPSSIVEVCEGTPLSFARTVSDSLTNRSETHIRTQVRGARRDYMEAAHFWHSQAIEPAQLCLPQHPAMRPFRAPAQLNMVSPIAPESDYDRLTSSPFFEEDWYLQAYPDVRQSGQGAARHYLSFGAREDRDPGPLFSSSGYRIACNLDPQENPLLHFLRHEEDKRELRLPTFAGTLNGDRRGLLTVLVFAHISGPTLFGAERSLLHVLERLIRDDYLPIVVLPSHHNSEYLARLRELSYAVETLPQAWRSGIHKQNRKTIAEIRALIRKYQPHEVHVNTVMLEAPLLAARAEKVPSVVYVREMPGEDPALCRSIAIPAPALRERLLDDADRFVVPSPAAAHWLACPARTSVRPNAVDDALFDLPFRPGRFLNVAMISSNITKKGIGDFAAVADLVARAGIAMRFLLIGPSTSDLEAIRPFPPNLHLCGYSASPVAAIKQADLVLSLSHFAESFGRTVVEAMAAGRPVICYDRGAPPSLVVNEQTGRVVASDSITAVADAVLVLNAARDKLTQFSNAARLRAGEIQRQALS